MIQRPCLTPYPHLFSIASSAARWNRILSSLPWRRSTCRSLTTFASTTEIPSISLTPGIFLCLRFLSFCANHIFVAGTIPSSLSSPHTSPTRACRILSLRSTSRPRPLRLPLNFQPSSSSSFSSNCLVSPLRLTFVPFLFVPRPSRDACSYKVLCLAMKLSSKKDAIDEAPFVVGFLTIIRQFHPNVMTQFLQYIGQYVKALVDEHQEKFVFPSFAFLPTFIAQRCFQESKGARSSSRCCPRPSIRRDDGLLWSHRTRAH